MQNFFGVEIDTANMTLEELNEARAKILKVLKSIDYELAVRKLHNHKHSSSN